MSMFADRQDRCWWCLKHDEVCKIVGEEFKAKFPDMAKQLTSPSCQTCIKRGKSCARTIKEKKTEEEKAKLGGKKRKVGLATMKVEADW